MNAKSRVQEAIGHDLDSAADMTVNTAGAVLHNERLFHAYQSIVDELHAELTHRERQILVIESSRSWRYTSFFRTFRRHAVNVPGISRLVQFLTPPPRVLPESVAARVRTPTLPRPIAVGVIQELPSREPIDTRGLSPNAKLLLVQTLAGRDT